MTDTHAAAVSPWRKIWESPLPEILILLAYLAVRLVAVTDTLPVFIDEATLISRARDVYHGHASAVMARLLKRGGKWLPVMLVSLLHPTGPETLWMARSVTALLATASCGVAIGLGRLFDSRLTGRVAGLLTVLMPLAVFHERQALADPLMAVFANLTLVMVALMARTGRWRYALASGVTLAAAVLAKLTGLLFLVLPIVGALILARRVGTRRKMLVQGVLASALALLLIGGFLLNIVDAGEAGGGLGSLVSNPGSFLCANMGIVCPGEDSQGDERWPMSIRLPVFRDIQAYYLSLPVLALAVGSLLLLRGPRGRAVGFLLVPALGLSVLVMLAGAWFVARYFNFAASSVAVLAALALVAAWRRGRAALVSWPGGRVATTAVLAGGVVVSMAWQLFVDLPWIRQPYAASVPPPDGYACQNFGYGYDRAGAILGTWWREHAGRVSVVTTDVLVMESYWGERAGGVEGWEESSDALRAELARWVAAGDAVFFVDAVPSRPIPDAPYGARLELLETISLPCSDEGIRVRRMVDAGPELLPGT